MDKIILKSEKRTITGRKVKSLRLNGIIPANIFGKNVKSEAISVNEKEFIEAFEKAGETQLIDLSGKTVLVSNVSYDPVSGKCLHIDFRQVDLKEKIEAKIPVETTGESPAEKQSLGTVVQQIDELEVRALPTELPESINVDISSLVEVDQAIYVKDLKIEGDVEILTDMESIVVKVEPPQKEEEPVVLPTAEETPDGEVKEESTGVIPETGKEESAEK